METSQIGQGPDNLKIDGDWKDATKKVLKKERPPEGWPSLEEMQAEEKGSKRPDRE